MNVLDKKKGEEVDESNGNLIDKIKSNCFVDNVALS